MMPNKLHIGKHGPQNVTFHVSPPCYDNPTYIEPGSMLTLLPEGDSCDFKICAPIVGYGKLSSCASSFSNWDFSKNYGG